MALTPARRAQLLAGVPLFSSASDATRAAIAGRAVDVDFAEGKRIARQGEVETGFFLVVTGSVRIEHDGEVWAHLGPGEFFGELSLLDQEPRIASAWAEEPTTCLALPSWEFRRLIQTNPGIAVEILQEVARRLRAVSAAQR